MYLCQKTFNMRIVFSIIHNGLHHLLHNNQYAAIISNCDFWIVVEGASLSNNSTKWCKEFPLEFHSNGKSIDGTTCFFENLCLSSNKIIYIPSNGFWHSKDHQVNRAIEEVKKITNKCFLWEIDIDEQWTSDQMDKAEEELVASKAKSACFRAECFIGKNLRAIGDWGEAFTSGYTRLWNWEGEYFLCHEPPVLEGELGKDPVMLSPVFKHYNYYFDKDVMFKDKWYGGHDQIYERWKLINSLDKRFFPMHISNLITGPWGNSNSSIIYVETNGKKKLIQIGANRGYDHVFEITKHNKHECILVEPNKYLIDNLKDCYKNCDHITIENCAISTFDGNIDMYFNDMEDGDSSHSSLSLSHVLDHNNKKENIIKSNVPCMKLESLIQKHGWTNDEIEWLFIDAEGHDCDIILSTDFSKFNIKNVFFETVHSDGSFKQGEKLQKTIDWLMSFGYLINAKKTTDESNLALSKI